MPIIAAILSAVFGSSKDLVSKKIAFNVNGTISAFASFLFALPFYFVVLAVLYFLGLESLTWSREIFILVFLRSVSDTGAELLKMHALSRADISLVSSVFAIYPLILLILSPIITGDAVSWPVISATFIIVAGSIALVWQSGLRGAGNQTKGILFALGAAFCFALNTSFDRLAAQVSTPVFASFTMTLFAAVFLLPFLYRSGKVLPQLNRHKGNFALRGLFEILFMVSKLYALRSLPAPYVVGIMKISLLLSILGGHFIFKEKDVLRRFVAGTLILLGVLLILFYG